MGLKINADLLRKKVSKIAKVAIATIAGMFK